MLYVIKHPPCTGGGCFFLRDSVETITFRITQWGFVAVPFKFEPFSSVSKKRLIGWCTFKDTFARLSSKTALTSR
jgi:hypothetical protein